MILIVSIVQNVDLLLLICNSIDAVFIPDIFTIDSIRTLSIDIIFIPADNFTIVSMDTIDSIDTSFIHDNFNIDNFHSIGTIDGLLILPLLTHYR